MVSTGSNKFTWFLIKLTIMQTVGFSEESIIVEDRVVHVRGTLESTGEYLDGVIPDSSITG